MTSFCFLNYSIITYNFTIRIPQRERELKLSPKALQLGNPSQLMWKIHGPSIISPQPSFSFPLKSQSVKWNVHPLLHPSPLLGDCSRPMLTPHSFASDFLWHKCWANPSSLSLNLEQETYTCRTSSLLAMRWKILSTRYWMEYRNWWSVFLTLLLPWSICGSFKLEVLTHQLAGMLNPLHNPIKSQIL